MPPVSRKPVGSGFSSPHPTDFAIQPTSSPPVASRDHILNPYHAVSQPPPDRQSTTASAPQYEWRSPYDHSNYSKEWSGSSASLQDAPSATHAHAQQSYGYTPSIASRDSEDTRWESSTSLVYDAEEPPVMPEPPEQAFDTVTPLRIVKTTDPQETPRARASQRDKKLPELPSEQENYSEFGDVALPQHSYGLRGPPIHSTGHAPSLDLGQELSRDHQQPDYGNYLDYELNEPSYQVEPEGSRGLDYGLESNNRVDPQSGSYDTLVSSASAVPEYHGTENGRVPYRNFNQNSHGIDSHMDNLVLDDEYTTGPMAIDTSDPRIEPDSSMVTQEHQLEESPSELGQDTSPPDIQSDLEQQKALGIGTGSDYIKRRRKAAGTTSTSQMPKTLPIGIKVLPTSKQYTAPPAFVRKAMDIRYAHLPQRMLASEIDDDDEGTAGADSPRARVSHDSGSVRRQFGHVPTHSLTTVHTNTTAPSFRRSSSSDSVVEDAGKIKLFVANPDD